jgi:DNA-directed RNA polymerase subunit RPC12/RpoP
MYIVVKCPRCGTLVLGNTMYKTRSCTACGFRVNLRGSKVIGRAESPRDAVELIQALKKREAGVKE